MGFNCKEEAAPFDRSEKRVYCGVLEVMQDCNGMLILARNVQRLQRGLVRGVSQRMLVGLFRWRKQQHVHRILSSSLSFLRFVWGFCATVAPHHVVALKTFDR